MPVLTLLPFSKQEEFVLECVYQEIIGGDEIMLCYQIQGNKIGFHWPNKSQIPERQIGLWESTCFEIFIKHKDGDEYFEFNFSPNGNWNCFYFAKRGEPLREAQINFNPKINHLEEGKLTVEINKNCLGDGFWEAGCMQVNISAVIESKEGNLSYWALEHKDSEPNFHNFSSFVLNL